MCKYALKHSVFFLEAAPSFSFYCPFRAPVKCAMMKGEWKRSVKHVKQPRNPRRLVVKVGTSTLTRETGSLNLQNMEHLARVLADLEGMGYQPVLVSSGAIGIGTKKLRLGERPTELRMKQAAAAVGQCRMMHIYDKLFAEYNRTVAQILLTGEDVESPVRSEHLHNTFEALLELGVIPVVNENDSVSSAEIETGQCKVLGDNDTLSAIVAHHFHKPMIFAKKAKSDNIEGGLYQSDIFSYTYKKKVTLLVSKEWLSADDKVLIIDDFMANGEAMRGLCDIVNAAGATLVGIGCAVEKGFQGGGDRLRAAGVNLKSLAIIESAEPGNIVFRGED